MGFAALPSGEQIEIRRGKLRSVIVEVGGGLRTLAVGDWEVLDGYPADEMCRDGRGQILIPWPNRLSGGRYTFEGASNQLPINEVSYGNAIHGLVRWVNWRTTDWRADSVGMSHRLYPSPGYPFTLDLSATYTLSSQGLEVTLRATNVGRLPCPFGAGQHPYVRVDPGLVNDVRLQVPARTIYRYDDQLIPVEKISVAGTPLDFGTARPIGDTQINMDYTDLERGGDGRARVLLQAPNSGRSVEVWMDGAFKHVTIYTGETVHAPERRRHGLAVEPMTCPPNAFVSGEDRLVLQPGETWSGTWGVAVRE
jgi:aldose 1-epimerase